jgi:methylglutaconyl-CoA hydratase
MSSLAAAHFEGPVATITLQRPEKRNALSLELIEDLARALDAVEAHRELRVMILAGAGPSFCAGMDLRGVIDDPALMGRMLSGLSMAMRRIRRLPVPTIARVQGAAIGGGCGLMVVTDFAITHAEARVGYPEVSLGVCPAVVAPWLIRRIGPGRARALLLLGGTMSGAEGHQVGLATHLAPLAELPAATDRLATQLVQGGREALAVTKRWINTLDGSLEDEVLDRSAELSARVIAGEEAQIRLRRVMGS